MRGGEDYGKGREGSFGELQNADFDCFSLGVLR
jgi:hypothetical protein